MRRRNEPFSIQNISIFGGVLAIGLVAYVRASAGEAPNSGEPVRLRDEPAFRKPITGEFRAPKAQDIIDLVRKETGQRISLDPSLIQDRPLLGDTKIHGVPAWAVLDNLAKNQYIKGLWTKRGDEYILWATYSGAPPPLPPIIPPHLQRAMDRAEKGLPPDPQPGAAPVNMGRERIWLIVVSAVLLIGLGVAVFWRRRAKAPAAAEKIRLTEKR
jgi:hypothetical protein